MGNLGSRLTTASSQKYQILLTRRVAGILPAASKLPFILCLIVALSTRKLLNQSYTISRISTSSILLST